MLPKLLVVGHGRHGKDTVCEILESYGYKFESSSKFCSELFIFDELKDKYNYADEEECYADRHNHRTEWYNMIHNYCKDDLARLGRNLISIAACVTGVNFLQCKTKKFLTMLFGLTAQIIYLKKMQAQ